MLREYQWQVARIAVTLVTGRNLRPVQDVDLLGREAKDEVARESTGSDLDSCMTALKVLPSSLAVVG